MCIINMRGIAQVKQKKIVSGNYTAVYSLSPHSQ